MVCLTMSERWKKRSPAVNRPRVAIRHDRAGSNWRVSMVMPGARRTRSQRGRRVAARQPRRRRSTDTYMRSTPCCAVLTRRALCWRCGWRGYAALRHWRRRRCNCTGQACACRIGGEIIVLGAGMAYVASVVVAQQCRRSRSK